MIAGTPVDENELIANQLKRIANAAGAVELERTRLLGAYQAGLLELDELTRRTATLTTRRGQLVAEQNTLIERNAELATENRLRRGLASFAERVAASLDELDPDARQRLMRLVVEKVRVTGWRVKIHLKIPLADDRPDDHRPPAWNQTRDRQAISACVLFVQLKGTSYRLRERGTATTPVRAPAENSTPQADASADRATAPDQRRRQHLAPLRPPGSAPQEAAATPQVAQFSTGAWCTFRLLKTAHFSVPVDMPS